MTEAAAVCDIHLKLVAWAGRVKVPGRRAYRLWLFTDQARLGDPIPIIRGLPRGAAGVVFRPEGVADRLATGRAIARLCRERRLALSVAGDWRLAAALQAGLHLRGGRRPGSAPRWLVPATASAHDRVEAIRGRRALTVFISPLFATTSHPGRRALGPIGWHRLAKGLKRPACLGGVVSGTVRALPRRSVAVGAIGALKRCAAAANSRS